MISLEQLITAWNDFFFNPVPVHTIALFRIILGLILLWEALYILANAKEYLGPDGLISYDRYYKRSRATTFSLFLYLPATMFSVYLVMGLHIVFLSLMVAGLFTPISIALSYITLRSIINRNPAICNGGDNVSRIMCFYLIFASSGHAFSLDEYFFYGPSMPDKEYLLQAPWATRLMQIQLSIIYIYTVYWKLKGFSYRDGTALYYVMGNYNYRRFSLPAIILKKPFVQLFTWGALLLEFILGSGIWIKEFRYPIILSGILFHLMIEYLMNVHLFSWYMMAALLLFIDPFDTMSFLNVSIPGYT